MATAKKKEEVLIDMITPKKPKTGSILKENGYDTVPKIIRNVVNPLLLLLKGAKAETEDIIATSFLNGMSLTEEPFIPEYLGFKETIIESETADFTIYSKDNYIVCKNRAGETKESRGSWIIKNSITGTHSIHKIDNMLEGTLILKSLMFETSIIDVVGCKNVTL
jgi:hypothetical protein